MVVTKDWRFQSFDPPVSLSEKIHTRPTSAPAPNNEQKPPTSEQAADFWGKAALATPAHPYLAAFGLQPHGLRLAKSLAPDGKFADPAALDLLIPMQLRTGVLHGFQRIGEDGTHTSKLFGSGTDLFYPLGGRSVNQDQKRVFLLSSSFKAAASIRQATNHQVLNCFSVDGMVNVARQLHANWSESGVITFVIDSSDYSSVDANWRRIVAAAWELEIRLAVSPAKGFNDLLRSEGGARLIAAMVENAVVPHGRRFFPSPNPANVKRRKETLAKSLRPAHYPPLHFGQPANIFEFGIRSSQPQPWFPGPIADYASEAGGRLGCDPLIVGMTALVAAATLIAGHHLNPDGQCDLAWSEPARFWSAFAGDPAALDVVRKVDCEVRACLPSHIMGELGMSVRSESGARSRRTDADIGAFRSTSAERLSIENDEAADMRTKKCGWSLAAVGASTPDRGPSAPTFGYAGALQRFALLVAVPVEHEPNQHIEESVAEGLVIFFKRLGRTSSQGFSASLSPEARLVFGRLMTWAAELGNQIDSPWLAIWLKNAPGLYLRLLLVTHIGEQVYGRRTALDAVNAATAERVEKLIRHGLFTHALHFDLNVVNEGRKGQHVRELARLMLRRGELTISRRDIQRFWKKARTLQPNDLDAAMNMLCLLQWIEPQLEFEDFPKKTQRWTINPVAHENFASYRSKHFAARQSKCTPLAE